MRKLFRRRSFGPSAGFGVAATALFGLGLIGLAGAALAASPAQAPVAATTSPGTTPAATAPSALPPPLPPMQEGMEDRGAAKLRMLDKVTARTSTVVVKVGTATRFRGLTITVRACRENPPSQAPESAAFLEIDEQTPDGAHQRAFSGWMFASSPALSAMDSAVYDVWVLACPAS